MAKPITFKKIKMASNKMGRIMRIFELIDLPKRRWVLRQYQAIRVASEGIFDRL
jgi:hypothetical protein